MRGHATSPLAGAILAALALSGCNALLGIEDPPPFDGAGGAAATGASSTSTSTEGTGSSSTSAGGATASSGPGGGGGEGGARDCVPIDGSMVAVESDITIPGKPRRVGETEIDAYVLYDEDGDVGTVATILFSFLESGATTTCDVRGDLDTSDDARGFLADFQGETHYVPFDEDHLFSIASDACEDFVDRDIPGPHLGAGVLDGSRLVSVDAESGELRQLYPQGDGVALSKAPGGRSLAFDLEVAEGRVFIAYGSQEEDGCVGVFEPGSGQPIICVPGTGGDVRAVAAARRHDVFYLEHAGGGARIVRAMDGSCWETDHPDAVGFDVDEGFVYIPLSDSLQICSLEAGEGCIRVTTQAGGAVSDVRVTPAGAFFAQEGPPGEGQFHGVHPEDFFPLE